VIRALALVALTASGAQAATFCDDIQNLQTSDVITLPTTPQRHATCAKGRALGGKSFAHCAIDFPFRARPANQAFDALSKAVMSCQGVTRREFTDQTVNHPDSYDLRLFDSPFGTVSLSLKDKGALQKTYVFLRVE
jgi:hypothetical protein